MNADERERLTALAAEWEERAEEIRVALEQHIAMQRAEEMTWRRAASGLRRAVDEIEAKEGP